MYSDTLCSNILWNTEYLLNPILIYKSKAN